MIGPKAIIHIDRLLSNYDRLKSHLNQKRIMAVVKADAYGHGSVQCARALENHGCDSFAVFSFSEALELRHGGVVSDILISMVGGGGAWQLLEMFVKRLAGT